MPFGKVFNKGGTDKTVIHNVRVRRAQPIQAPGWTDLRVGWLLSLTNAAADDTITTLTETIGTEPRPFLPWTDRYAIGLTDRTTGGTFLGYTNVLGPRINPSVGSSKLVSSDAGIGTSNSNFWRPKNELSDLTNAAIIDGGMVRSHNGAAIPQHFVQNTVGAGGYATMLMIRYRRSSANSRTIRMEIKQGTNACDILFTNTPTKELLLANLEAFPTTVQQIGPVELSQAPDAFFVYWPFTLSRLRIHAEGFLRKQ